MFAIQQKLTTVWSNYVPIKNTMISVVTECWAVWSLQGKLQTQGRVAVDLGPEGHLLEEPPPLQGTPAFSSLGFLTEWRRPTLIMEENLLYSNSTSLNVNLTWKLSSWQHLDLTKLTHEINGHRRWAGYTEKPSNGLCCILTMPFWRVSISEKHSPATCIEYISYVMGGNSHDDTN